MISMKEIEVLKAGIANDGREVSEDTINEIYRNTLEATAEGFIPKVKIGGNHRDATVEGIITALNLKNGSLFADIELTAEVFDKLQNRTIPDNRSAEIGFGFTLSTGRQLDSVLTGVVFGVDIPAEHTLQSIFESSDARFESKTKRFEVFCYRNPEIPITSATTQLRDLTERNQTLERENRDLKDRLDKELFTRQSERDTENTRQKTVIETMESELKKAFLERMVETRRIPPSMTEQAETLYDTFRKQSDRTDAERRVSEFFCKLIPLHTEPAVRIGESVLDPNNGINPIQHIANGGN